MTGWTVAKYALALAGVMLVLLGDSLSRPWLGYLGLPLITAAFLLRFAQRRAQSRSTQNARDEVQQQ